MANPHPSKGKPAHVGAHQREIPDPVAWMKAHAGPNEGSPGGDQTGQPVQGFGRSMPEQGTSAPVGFESVNSHGQAQNGRQEPSSQFRGNGQKKAELSPNNQKHAGSMTKGKPASGMPSKNAIARRLNKVGASKAKSAKKQQGRTGNLKNFEGFRPKGK